MNYVILLCFLPLYGPPTATNYVRSRPHASKRLWPVHREMIPNQC